MGSPFGRRGCGHADRLRQHGRRIDDPPGIPPGRWDRLSTARWRGVARGGPADAQRGALPVRCHWSTSGDARSRDRVAASSATRASFAPTRGPRTLGDGRAGRPRPACGVFGNIGDGDVERPVRRLRASAFRMRRSLERTSVARPAVDIRRWFAAAGLPAGHVRLAGGLEMVRRSTASCSPESIAAGASPYVRRLPATIRLRVSRRRSARVRVGVVRSAPRTQQQVGSPASTASRNASAWTSYGSRCAAHRLDRRPSSNRTLPAARAPVRPAWSAGRQQAVGRRSRPR